MAKRRDIFRQERIDFAKFQKNAEKEVLPIVRKALAKSLEPLFSWVRVNGVENAPLDILIDKNVWRTLYPTIYETIGMRAARKEYYFQRTQEGLASKASAIDFLVDVWSGKLRDFALTYTYRIERLLNDTTEEIIKRALGKDYGLGIDRLGRTRLFERDVKGEMRARTLTISRTEVTTVSNIGKDIAARSWIEENGGKGYKMWLGRVAGERDTHLAENNTILPIDDMYNVGGSLAERPGDVSLPPKERINCRCSQSIMSENRYNRLVKLRRIQNGKVI